MKEIAEPVVVDPSLNAATDTPGKGLLVLTEPDIGPLGKIQAEVSVITVTDQNIPTHDWNWNQIFNWGSFTTDLVDLDLERTSPERA